MKCTECTDLGERIDYLTFVCNYSASLLSLDDVNEDRPCPKYPAGIGLRKEQLEKSDFTCSTCGEGFDTRSELMKHKQIHLTCKYCGKKFKNSGGRMRHEKTCKARGQKAC